MRSATLLLMTGLILALPAMADDSRGQCSTRMLAGKWVFATDVGQFSGLGSITALGTIDIERDGSLSGRFDVTIADLLFGPGNTATGSVTVNHDCTGTLTFTDSTGQSRSDSIVVVSSKEIWGMSQSPGVLWTYRVRKLGSGRD